MDQLSNVVMNIRSYDDEKGIRFESFSEDWTFIEIHFPEMFGRSNSNQLEKIRKFSTSRWLTGNGATYMDYKIEPVLISYAKIELQQCIPICSM